MSENSNSISSAILGIIIIIVIISAVFDIGAMASIQVLVGSIIFIVVVVVLIKSIPADERTIREAEADKRRRQTRQEHENKKIKFVIKAHAKALSIKRSQLVYIDTYGLEKKVKWVNEIDYFIDNVLKKEVEFIDSSAYREKLHNVIENCINEYNSENVDSTGHEYNDDIDPYEYEHFCASVLTKHGWKAQATQASGDQGADVIAEKGDLKVALQCKKYSQPVGNKAVQEVFAAKGWANATHAAVVSNASYTPSAHQLAGKLGVHLLHHDQLSDLESVVLWS